MTQPQVGLIHSNLKKDFFEKTSIHNIGPLGQLTLCLLASTSHATVAFSPARVSVCWQTACIPTYSCKLPRAALTLNADDKKALANQERAERQQEWRTWKKDIKRGDFKVKKQSSKVAFQQFSRRIVIGLLLALSLFASGQAFTMNSELASMQFSSPTAIERRGGWLSPTFQDSRESGLSVYSSPSQVRNPRLSDSWVSDNGKYLSPSAIFKINLLAEKVKASTSAELAVVTVPDVSGSPKSFATRLFDYWGVGDPLRNNGVVVLVVPEQRRVEVEIGKGLNKYLNAGEWLQSMEDTEMSPRFKDGDYDGGVLAGVERLAVKLESLSGEQMQNIARQEMETARTAAAICSVLALGTAGAVAAQDELSKPVCSRCKSRMRSADGAWDAEEAILEQRIAQRLLTQEDRLEQKLGSVLFGMYSCTTPDCILHRADTTRVEGWGEVDEQKLQELVVAKSTVGLRRDPVLFSAYSDCPSCSRRTMLVSTSVLMDPSENNEGSELVQSECANCGFFDERIREVPRLEESSSSFNGGSSSGGGRGSSW